MFIDSFNTPLGWFTVVVDDRGAAVRVHMAHEPAGLGALDWPSDAPPPEPSAERTRQVREQLIEYARGERLAFDLPLAPSGTAFQQAAWGALRAIPYGETRSYAQQAASVGNPQGVRAIGQANGRNRLAVVIPCHRVIGAGGGLVGFTGGVDLKRRLLEHEQRVLAQQAPGPRAARSGAADG